MRLIRPPGTMSAVYGDPAAMQRLADTITAGADQLRSDATAAVNEAEATHWVGAAAAQHRDHIQNVANALRTIATRLDEAAEDLRAYAAQVAAVQAEIAEAETQIRQWFDAAENDIAHGISVVAGGVEQGVGEVWQTLSSSLSGGGSITPPWQGWPWSPGNLPETGSKQWLDLGGLINGGGR